MEYYIINKIEYIDNQIVYTPVGYNTDINEITLISNTYNTPFENWVNANKADLENEIISISEFFIDNPKVYEANEQTTSIDGMNLTLKNFNDL